MLALVPLLQHLERPPRRALLVGCRPQRAVQSIDRLLFGFDLALEGRRGLGYQMGDCCKTPVGLTFALQTTICPRRREGGEKKNGGLPTCYYIIAALTALLAARDTVGLSISSLPVGLLAGRFDTHAKVGRPQTLAVRAVRVGTDFDELRDDAAVADLGGNV